MGLETLAAAVGEDKGTLEDVVEPFLIHEGFLARTPRGRVATPLCLSPPRAATCPAGRAGPAEALLDALRARGPPIRPARYS